MKSHLVEMPLQIPLLLLLLLLLLILFCVFKRTESKIRKNKITPVPQAKGDRLLCSDHENNTQHSNDCLVALSVQIKFIKFVLCLEAI